MGDYGVYAKIQWVHDEYGGKIVVDSAFNLSNQPFLVKSAQQDPIGDSLGVIINREATSVRQLSEHGMRMIQAQFPRMLDKLPYEEFGERKVILQLMVLLYNYQASKVGINEILNSFMEKTKYFYHYDELLATANNLF